MLLLGAQDCDTIETADRMVDKICKLRIFQDENGKTNLGLADVNGEILAVSQFTLYADCKRETGQALFGQESQNRPMPYTNT